MATGRADGRGRGAVASALVVGLLLLATAVVLVATRVEGGREPRESIPGARTLPVAAVASAPERYLGSRIAVRGRVGRVGEAGFALAGGRRALLVLGPTGGPFPRVERGDAVAVRGTLRRLEPREWRRLGADPRLPAPGDRPVLVATSVSAFPPADRPGEAVRP